MNSKDKRTEDEELATSFTVRNMLERKLLHLISNTTGDNVKASIRFLKIIEFVEEHDRHV